VVVLVTVLLSSIVTSKAAKALDPSEPGPEPDVPARPIEPAAPA
jgi:hypothetical protein